MELTQETLIIMLITAGLYVGGVGAVRGTKALCHKAHNAIVHLKHKKS